MPLGWDKTVYHCRFEHRAPSSPRGLAKLVSQYEVVNEHPLSVDTATRNQILCFLSRLTSAAPPHSDDVENETPLHAHGG